MASLRPGAPRALWLLSISVVVRGGVGLFNLRPLLGTEFPRPPLGDIEPPADLTFRGDLLGDVVSAATDELDSLRTREAPQGFQNQSRTGAAYPSRLHGMHRKPLEEVLNDSYFARTAIRATQLLQKRLALSGAEVAFRLPLYDLAATRLGRVCPPHHGARYPACDSAARYRTADGTCNNVQFSWWGSARSAFVRLLPPDYGDKVDSPRAAADGSALPSARRVSAACLSQPLVVSELSERISLMVMQWGQFLDHDLSHTPMSTATLYGRPVSCCGLSDPGQHPACYPISVPRGDSLSREHGQTCMEFARSVPALHNGCGLGPREQVNQVTSYIDGSVVYGSSDAEMGRLRQFEGGRMKTEDSRLPTTEDEGGCIRQRRDVRCFQSGDIRVNEQPDLTTLHTLWLREHNRVAGRLQRYCPAWDDETLFQESRRLVAAMLQHVTYREWVPLVVGPRLAARHGLQPLQEGYFSDYSPDVDATIANVFATGAMRFGHTLVPDHLMLFTPWHTKLAGVALHKNFFRPHSLYHPGRIDEYMAGLANANSSEADNYLVDTIRNRLFAPPGARFGLDLGALNIQRGRDHGLPSYVQWRRACRLTPVDSFAQLKTVMSPLAVAKLITTYKDLDDVDLYVGGLLETPLEGALVGPTLACLMANQFQTLRRGDRFWYENGDERHSFTPGQLRELRKVTLSKVICDNSALATIQPDIMFKPDDTSNQRVKCRHLPALDLRLWASELGCVAPQRPQTGSGGRPGPARPPPFWPGGRPAGGPTPFPGGPPPAGSTPPPFWPGGRPAGGPTPFPGSPPPAGSTPPPTRPAAGTDDSLERPVFPGSEPTEPVTPTGAGPSTGPATSDGQPPSWEPQPPSQAPAVEPPAQVVPVDPAVLPPSEPTPGPAVVPVDPAVWPPSRPTPGAAPLPEIAVDPPRTTTPRPTPGPAVIPVDPPVLPPAGPTPGPVAPVPVSPPLLPPGEPLQPAPAPLPTPGPHQPIHPPVLPPAPAPTPGPGEGIRPASLPTPGPHQPIHPPVLPPAPGPGAQIRPTPGPGAQILPAPVPGPGVEVLPTPGPGAQIQPPVQPPPVPFPPRPTPTMMMSAMTLTVPAALWPTAPGKQLVIVAGRRPVVTIIPVPRPALGGPSALSSLPPAVIFPSRESVGGGGAPASVSGTPTVPAMTIEATGSFTTLSMLTSLTASVSVTPVTSAVPATSVVTPRPPPMPVFPPGFDPDFPFIPPGESIEIEPTDTGPSGGETTVTIPDIGQPVYPDTEDPDLYPDYLQPGVEPEYPDGGWEEVSVPTSPGGTQPLPPGPTTDFDYPTIPAGESIAIEPTDTEYDDGPPTVVWVPDAALPDRPGSSPHLEPSVQPAGAAGGPSTPIADPAGGRPGLTPAIPAGAALGTAVSSVPAGATEGGSASSILTGVTLEPSVSSILTGATLIPSLTSFTIGGTFRPSIYPFITGATLRPSISFITGATLEPVITSILTGATLWPSISFITGATLKPSLTSFITGATLKPSVTSFLTGATLKPSISFITGATLKPSLTSFITGATLTPSISFITGATLKPSATSFITGATLTPSVTSFVTGVTLKPSLSFITGATLKPSLTFITGATLKPSVTSFITGATLKPSVTPFITGATLQPSLTSFITGATLKPSISFITGATLRPSVTSFITGATLKPSVTSFITGATLKPSFTSFITGATLTPSISFITGATLRPSVTSFITGATLKPSVTSFITGATLNPSVTSLITGATLKPSVTSFITGATQKPSVTSFITGATLSPSVTSVHPSATLTVPSPVVTPSRPVRPQVTSWLTFETVVVTGPYGPVTAIRPGSTAVTVRPSASAAPVMVTSIVWSRPSPAGWPPRPRPGPPQVTIIAGPTPTMAGVHRPGATLTIESAAAGGMGPAPAVPEPRPTATLTVTVTAQRPARPGTGRPGHGATGGVYPGLGGSLGGYPGSGGTVGGYPNPGGSVGGYPSPGASFGGYPSPGGSVQGYPRPGGSIGGYPSPGGSFGGYPRPGGSFGGYPSPGGSPGGYPRPGGSFGGYPMAGPAVYPTPRPPTGLPKPAESNELTPEDGSDSPELGVQPTDGEEPIQSLQKEPGHPVQTKPTGDLQPIPVLGETGHPVQSKPIGDVEPIIVRPPETGHPVQSKPIGDVQPVPVLPAEPDRPVQTKPIGEMKPIPVLPAESDRPVQTKPTGDVKPISVLPAEPGYPVQTKPTGDIQPIPVLPAGQGPHRPTDDQGPPPDRQTPSTMAPMKPDGLAQPMPSPSSDLGSNVLTKPVGHVQPIPVLGPAPQPSTAPPAASSSTTARPSTSQPPPPTTTERPTTTTSRRPSVTPVPARPGALVSACEATGAWRWVPGMSQWCTSNCLMKNPPFCPPSHCHCW